MIYLVFDIGTSGTKAALLSETGEILKSSYRDYPIFAQVNGVVEQDANDWWKAACEAIKELEPQNVKAIILTGQMQNLILLDNSGERLRNVILYSDTRATHEAEIIKQRLGIDNLRNLTGNDQEASGLLAKLSWLKEHEPEVLQKAKHLLLGAADYLVFKLCGDFVCDTTTASTTGLMNLQHSDWLSADIFSAINLDISKLLPKLVSGGTQVGVVQPEASQVMGVPEGIPVYLAPGDAGTATLGIGSGEAGKPYAYIGSSGWVAFSSSQKGNPETGVFTLAHPRANMYICVAPLLTAGGNLDWAYKQLGFDNHEQMIEAALTQAPSNLIYLPYLNGERSPFSDPHARACFIGLGSHHTKAHLARAVLEGVAFAYKHALDALITEPFSELALTGGGARSLTFCQLLSDVLAVKVLVPEEAEHNGLRGALIAVQVNQKERENYAVELNGLRLEPSVDTDDQAKYQWFREAYLSLKPLFQKIASDTKLR
jgi:xylulokinase